MLTKDPKKKIILNPFTLTHNKTEEYNDEYHPFVEVLSSCCRLLIERKDDAGDTAINKWLYLALNLSPVLEQQESEYSGIIRGVTTIQKVEKLKGQLCSDLKTVLKWISAAPIIYDKPEEDLAKLHFSGAFGRGIPDKSAYDYEPSWAVRIFDLNVYKQIRSSFTVEDLELIESREMKLAVLYLLTGYYIDAYYNVVSSILRKAGLNYVITTHGTQQDKLMDILKRLSHNRYKEFIEDKGLNPPSKNEKKYILDKNFCNLKNRDELIKFLESLLEECKIGTRACSKRDFVNIVCALSTNLSCWREKRFAPSKRVLSMFYGIQEPTYKVNARDYSAFVNTTEGKTLLSRIERFNNSLEQKT